MTLWPDERVQAQLKLEVQKNEEALPSAIDEILARDDFTLEELLDDEGVLQECRNQNQKLIEFLSAPENVKQMLDYATKLPISFRGNRNQFKFMDVASKILTTDNHGIMQVKHPLCLLLLLPPPSSPLSHVERNRERNSCHLLILKPKKGSRPYTR